LSLKLYLDENVHRAITAGLRLRGIDVLTVQEDGRRGLPDPEVLDRATELGRPLFTQDDDLLAEARHRQKTGSVFAGVLYAHQQHVTIGDCVRNLELIARLVEPEELAGKVEFLPL
jgi:predicted nuclease of predicted toxin-antitoxin system